MVYRWGVLLLALGYWLYQFHHHSSGPNVGFGWQFRYLTIWALTASLLSAWAVLRLSMGWTDHRPETLAGVAAVMNVVVVAMYWKLYFDDPSSVNNGPILWWQEYYLHVVGPLLQWIDAFLILGVFRRVRPVGVALVAVVLAYVGWAELVVQPTNDRPVGTVTSGLPYPFLNNLQPTARAVFYASTASICLVVMAGGWLVSRALNRRGVPVPAVPPDRRGRTGRAAGRQARP